MEGVFCCLLETLKRLPFPNPKSGYVRVAGFTATKILKAHIREFFLTS